MLDFLEKRKGVKMVLNASQLRKNIYKLLDKVAQTGIPIEIDRKGKRLRIISVKKPSKLDNIKKKDGILNCDPEELVHIDWSHEWKP